MIVFTSPKSNQQPVCLPDLPLKQGYTAITMTGKTVVVVCLLLALTHRGGARCLLLDVIETGDDLSAAKWLHLDDDTIHNLPAESFHLEVNPTYILLGQTKLLAVNCSITFDQVSNMSGITSLMVSRSVTKENQQENFIDLVSVNVFTQNQITRQSQFDGSAVGQIDNDGVSFIAIEWSNPTDDQAGLFRCKVHGMDNLGYPTEVVRTKRVTSQQPNLDWLTQKVSQFQIQIEHQNNLSRKQTDEIKRLSNLANNQSDDINNLSNLANNQLDDINKLSNLANNQLDDINKLSNLANNQSDEINKLSNLANNQSEELDEVLTLTNVQSHIISSQGSQLDNQSVMITEIQMQLQLQGVLLTASSKFEISLKHNGHHYLLSKQDWENATVSGKTCKDYGGYLAEINDDNENQFVKDFLDQHTGFDRVLISGTDSEHEGRWTYTGTDIDLVFTNWKPGEPNEGESDNCLYLNRNYQWSMCDWECTHQYDDYKFLCELDIPSIIN